KHVRMWTALSITDLFQDHAEYDMYSESVGDHFRSIVGDKLGDRANPRALVAALIEAFPDPESADPVEDDEESYKRNGTDVAAMSDALVRAVVTCLHAEHADKQGALEAAATAVTFVLDRFEAGDEAVAELLVRLGTATREHDVARQYVSSLIETR